MEDVHAAVLTYNRRELALGCIRSLLDQTVPLKSVIVLDNGGTDGTYNAIQALNDPRIDLVRLDKNAGPAGGFNALMKHAYETRKVRWAYIMDDDVICSPTAVEELFKAYSHNFTAPEQVGFLLSQAVDAEGRPNNVPAIETRPRKLGECPDWGRFLDQAIVGVRGAPVSGFLMPHTSYEAYGGLLSEFVMWGEDLELTFRITEDRPGLLVGTSKIVHLRSQQGDISIFLENNRSRIPNFYYLYRNQMYVRRRYMGLHAYANGLVRGLWETTRLVADGKLWKAQFAFRGTLAGLTFKPVIPTPSGQQVPVAPSTAVSAPSPTTLPAPEVRAESEGRPSSPGFAPVKPVTDEFDWPPPN